jgi:two-component SAPR family response regulator
VYPSDNAARLQHTSVSKCMRHVLDWSKQPALLNDQTMVHPHLMAWRRRQFRSLFFFFLLVENRKSLISFDSMLYMIFKRLNLRQNWSLLESNERHCRHAISLTYINFHDWIFLRTRKCPKNSILFMFIYVDFADFSFRHFSAISLFSLLLLSFAVFKNLNT